VAVFSAGTDATGNYTISVYGTQQVAGILKEDGGTANPAVSGASGALLQFVGPNPFYRGSMTLNSMTIEGSNTLTLSAGSYIQDSTLIRDWNNSPSTPFSILVAASGSGTIRNPGNTFSGGVTLDTNGILTFGRNPGASTLNPDNGTNNWLGVGTIVLRQGSILASRQPAILVSNSWRTLPNAVVIDGDTTINASRALGPTNGFNYVTLAGPVSLTGNRMISVSEIPGIGTPTNTVTEISGEISDGGGNYQLRKGGIGLLVLSGSNSFTGGLEIRDGYVALGGANALNPAAPNVVSFASTNRTKVFALNGNDVTVGGVTTGPTVGNSIVANGAVGTATLTVSNSADSIFGGVLDNGTAGSLVLIKAGTGVLALAGANTYTGSTTVAGGTLLVNGTHIGSGIGDYVIQGGGVLGGTGLIAAAIHVLANGVVAPGASVGTLTTSNGFDLDGVLQIDLANAAGPQGASDMLDVNGHFDLTNGTVQFVFGGTMTNDHYVFAEYDSLSGDAFLDVLNLPAGYMVDYQFGAGNNQIALVIPEPSTFALIGFGALVFVGGRLRNRKRPNR
jgi:autotransporter-associated beta strand protein